jgi:hypothetical protein
MLNSLDAEQKELIQKRVVYKEKIARPDMAPKNFL